MIVPVLSNTTVLIEAPFSKISPLLTIIPFFAPMPVPTSTAVGVASPIAQGQATTRVEIPNLKANVNFEWESIWIEVVKTSANQTIQENIAIQRTKGTKRREILSENFWIGIFPEPWMRFIISDIEEFSRV